jgi:tripartite-type tricarboxylate transporter receptor subunit TctC
MLRIIVVSVISLATITGAVAQSQPRTTAATYPDRSIRLLVPYSAGGGVDVVARILAQKMTETLGQPVVADNRPGAGGNIAAEILAKSPPDGYTLMHTNSAISVASSLYRNLSFDPARDLEPVIQISSSPHVMVVSPTSPTKTVKEFLQLAKAKPGELSIGSSGIGASDAMAIELFAYAAQIKILHVPYKGSVPALADVWGGRLSASFPGLGGVVPFLQSGKLRALAVSTAKRSPSIPDVPTMMEAGVPEYEAVLWYAIYAPARTPKPVIAKLNAEFNKLLRLPDVRERFSTVGVDPVGGTPEELNELFKVDFVKWKKVIEAGNIQGS